MVPQTLARHYRIYPTAVQAEVLVRTFGCTRVVWNRALTTRSTTMKAITTKQGATKQVHLSYEDLSALLTGWKKEESFFYLQDVPAIPLQQTLRHLDTAVKGFLAGRTRYPRGKRKHRCVDSAEFTTSGFVWKEQQRSLVLARVPGALDIRWGTSSDRDAGGQRLPWYLPTGARITTVTITKDSSGAYYVALRFQQEITPLPPTEQETGIDLGLERIVVTAQGEKIANPRHHRKLRRKDRALARKLPGSRNWEKARKGRAKAHATVRHVRRDFQHQVTTRLVRENQVIVVEGLNIAGMLQNHHLARAIADVGWGEWKRQIQYKCAWYGRTYVCLDRWTPTTTPCSTPGCDFQHPGHLDLHIRVWTCPTCGTTHDRDINAARNILAAGHAVLRARGQQSACGAPHTPRGAPTVHQAGGENLCHTGAEKQETSVRKNRSPRL